MDNKLFIIVIFVFFDKKLVKLSKFILVLVFCCFKLFEIIVDIIVLVNESLFKINMIIIVMNYDVVFKRKEVVKKLIERNVILMFNMYKGFFLLISILLM